jgi:hypothetical protein
MEGHERFNPDTILEARVSLPVRQLMDVAPVVRKMLVNGMKSTAKRARRMEMEDQAIDEPTQPTTVALKTHLLKESEVIEGDYERSSEVFICHSLD